MSDVIIIFEDGAEVVGMVVEKHACLDDGGGFWEFVRGGAALRRRLSYAVA
jgi:hypothetical protein